MTYLLLMLNIAGMGCFALGVPGLLIARARNAFIPWWFILAAATALGWLALNGRILLQHLAVEDSIHQQSLCFAEALPAKHSAPQVSENGTYETVISNPCGLGDWIEDAYEPLLGLAFGPIYLMCCALPYWLIIARRGAPGQSRQIAWLSLGALTIEWTALLGNALRPGGFATMHPGGFILIPLTVGVALLAGWFVASQIISRFATTERFRR